MKKGQLYLIPVPLGESAVEAVLPAPVLARARSLSHFVAENAKSARAFLKALAHPLPIREIAIEELNEHTPAAALAPLLAPLLAGYDVGLVSEAGCPAVADPGAQLVALAHREHITVVPMIGPSSILLALMGSGLSGQQFAFHGYLPAKDDLRGKKIVELENESRKAQRTQIFIETPYRNRQMLETLIRVCAPHTRIGVASDLTLPAERIATHTAGEWRKLALPDIDRRPTVFLLQA